MKRKVALGASLTLAVYGFAGWVYIALVALVHPHTLVLQLTHFTKLPHEDTFGETCFIVSMVSFFIYKLLRFSDPKSGPLNRTSISAWSSALGSMFRSWSSSPRLQGSRGNDVCLRQVVSTSSAARLAAPSEIRPHQRSLRQ